MTATKTEKNPARCVLGHRHFRCAHYLVVPDEAPAFNLLQGI